MSYFIAILLLVKLKAGFVWWGAFVALVITDFIYVAANS